MENVVNLVETEILKSGEVKLYCSTFSTLELAQKYLGIRIEQLKSEELQVICDKDNIVILQNDNVYTKLQLFNNEIDFWNKYIL